MGKELPYEVTISREQAYSPGSMPRYRGHIHAHPQQQKEEGNKARQSFHLHCELSIWLLFSGIKLPGKKMKVPASWQEAGERASSIQLELDSIKFKKKIPSKAEHH